MLYLHVQKVKDKKTIVQNNEAKKTVLILFKFFSCLYKFILELNIESTWFISITLSQFRNIKLQQTFAGG